VDREKLKRGGNAIRLRRHELEMSLQDVEKISGIPNQLISRVETARIDRPPFEYIVKIGDALGWTPNKMAVIYGLWDTDEPITDDRVMEVRRMMKGLPHIEVDNLIETMAALALQAQRRHST
jgi:transcriptional regulator with XRE-family HTH domain